MLTTAYSFTARLVKVCVAEMRINPTVLDLGGQNVNRITTYTLIIKVRSAE